MKCESVEEHKSGKALYASPAAENIALPVADLHVLRRLAPIGRLKDISMAWAGFFVEADHKIVFRLTGEGCKMSGVSDAQWFVPYCHFRDSSSLVMPVAICSDGSTPFGYLKFHEVKQPYFLPALSID